MERRNVEGEHEFAKAIAERFNLFELGGLLLDANWDYTAVVEAFELTKEEKGHHLSDLMEANGFSEGLYMAGRFAKRLEIPFFLIAHVQEEPHIYIYRVTPDEEAQKLQCQERRTLTEAEFAAWWKEWKGTVQTKPYRSDLQGRVKHSYFDKLLETHKLRWGGNIDGYMAVSQAGAFDIAAIIENRFTNKTELEKYDPNDFFHVKYDGGDFNTWRPLIRLKDKLKIPLFLMTYSNRAGEEQLVGITQVIGLSQKEGLLYMQNPEGKPIRPYNNIFATMDEIQTWLQGRL